MHVFDFVENSLLGLTTGHAVSKALIISFSGRSKDKLRY